MSSETQKAGNEDVEAFGIDDGGFVVVAPEGFGGVDEKGAFAHGAVFGKEAAEGFGGGFGGGGGSAGAGELLGGDVLGFGGDGCHDVDGEDHRDGVDDHVRRDGQDAQCVADEGNDDDDFQVARRNHGEGGQEGESDEEDCQGEWVGLEHGGLSI